MYIMSFVANSAGILFHISMSASRVRGLADHIQHVLGRGWWPIVGALAMAFHLLKFMAVVFIRQTFTSITSDAGATALTLVLVTAAVGIGMLGKHGEHARSVVSAGVTAVMVISLVIACIIEDNGLHGIPAFRRPGTVWAAWQGIVIAGVCTVGNFVFDMSHCYIGNLKYVEDDLLTYYVLTNGAFELVYRIYVSLPLAVISLWGERTGDTLLFDLINPSGALMFIVLSASVNTAVSLSQVPQLIQQELVSIETLPDKVGGYILLAAATVVGVTVRIPVFEATATFGSFLLLPLVYCTPVALYFATMRTFPVTGRPFLRIRAIGCLLATVGCVVMGCLAYWNVSDR